MRKSNPLRYLYWPFLTTRSRIISKLISPYIEENSTVLDVGIGNGLIADNLARTKKLGIHGLDVLYMNLTDIPQTIFDGQNIPFATKSYDVSLLVGVLHHVNEQEELLNEVVRVTISKIVIFEDVFRSRVGEKWVKFRDVIGNLPEERHMNFALNFRSEKEWESLFRDFELEVRHKSTLFNLFRLTNHALFILQPNQLPSVTLLSPGMV